MSEPLSLSASAVLLVLDLISPPSLLSPLPSNILSSSLRQRHHFLQILPNEPLDYLAWSSSFSKQTLIDILERIPKPIKPSHFFIRYASDAESTFAHVAMPADQPELRLIFILESDGWKYHDLASMPFPPQTHASMEDVSIFQKSNTRSTTNDVDREDPYWDAYERRAEIFNSEEPCGYFSRFDYDSDDGAIINEPSSNYNPRCLLSSFKARSPNTSGRLYREDHSSVQQPLTGDDATVTGTDIMARFSSTIDCQASPHLLYPRTEAVHSVYGLDVMAGPEELSQSFRDAIHGIYKLWTFTQWKNHPVSKNREAFIDMVRQVVATSNIGPTACN